MAVLAFLSVMAFCRVPAAEAQGRDLFALCAEGTLAEVQAAVRAGADLDAKRYPDKMSLLVSALENPDSGVLKFLLGAKKGGWDKALLGKALYEACSTSIHNVEFKPDIRKVRLLLEAGADVNTKDKMNWTPLFAALFYIFDGEEEPVDLELVRLLIEAGADVNGVDDKGETPLYWAVAGEDGYRRAEMTKAAEATGRIKDMLLEAGAKGIETMQGKPLSPQERALISACYQEDVQAVRRLIAAGVDVNATDPIRKTTPILAVASHYDEEDGPVSHYDENGLIDDFDWESPNLLLLIRGLARAGANLNVKSRWGSTILHSTMGSSFKSSPAVQALLEAGADVNVRDAKGRTPLALLRFKMREMRERAQNVGEDASSFRKGMAEKGRIESLLLKAGGKE